MSDEHIVSLQSSMQFLPTRLPVIILRRVEEQFPALMKIMVSAMCLCADKIILSSYSDDFFFFGSENKIFSWYLMQPFIFCGLRF